MTKGTVAKASIQEQLDIVVYFLSIISQVESLVTSFTDKQSA